MKYIDADKLIAGIKHLQEKFPVATYDALYHLVTSLQQEQPEESISKEAIQLVFEEKLTPFKDGNQWRFLLGHNIQEGVCGFGDTILDAAIDFYKDYSTTRIHIGELKKTMEQPEVDLEKAARYVYESWMGGTMDDVRRDMVELGKVLNARKEE